MNVADNPFFLLDASPRDSKRIIHEKAENKSFDLPDETCKNAERILLNPRKRLGAEISWFPGVSPKKVKEVLKKIIEDASNHNYDPDFFRQFDNLPRANAFAFFLSNVSDPGYWSQDDIENIVGSFCEFASKIDADPTLSSINDDRVASGFPEISSAYDVKQALEEQQHYYKKILHSFLDGLDSCVIVDTLTHLIEDDTISGEFECDWPLLDDIITDYEMDAIPFFEKQEELIEADIADLSEDMEAKKNWAQIREKCNVLRNDILLWDRIAQPVQVLLRSKGIDHKRSEDLSDRLRDFSLLAHNQYGYTELSLNITELQQSVFAELRFAAETAADDRKQLQEILKNRKEQEEATAKFKKELLYFCEWGLFFKKSVRFDSESITINGTDRYKLSDIKALLWGATRNSVNGVPTGTTYNVAFIARNQAVWVPIKDDTVYDNVVQRLWKTAGISILYDMLDKLKKGNAIPFGDIHLFNDGIELTHKKFFSSEKMCIPWSEVKPPHSYNGNLMIESTDGKFKAFFAYQTDPNTHILDVILKTVCKHRGAKTVTEAFQMEN